MICGIGVDLCDIERMRRAIKQKGFCDRVFSREEIDYASSKADPAKHYAGSFASREALAKATGWGMAKMGFNSCYVARSECGPSFIFTQQLLEKLNHKKIDRVFLSISHEGNMAVAMVVLENLL